MTQSKYVFADNSEERERERLRQFEAWGDRYTTHRLESIGIPAGWRCLDVGAGSGSVATLLAHRVGPSGTVVAADIDLRFLTNLPPKLRCLPGRGKTTLALRAAGVRAWPSAPPERAPGLALPE
jgi:SAM-dependent methyltransferase